MIHHKSVEVNQGKYLYNRLHIAEDHELQESDSTQRMELIMQLESHQNTNTKGTHANNAAATADFGAALKSIHNEVSKFSRLDFTYF